MSIKLCCDQMNSSLYSISLSPRRDVAKKRLKRSNTQPPPPPPPMLSSSSIVLHEPNKLIGIINHNLIKLITIIYIIIIVLVLNNFIQPTNALLIVKPTADGSSGLVTISEHGGSGSSSSSSSDYSNNNSNNVGLIGGANMNNVGGGLSNSGSGVHYLDKLDNLERSLAAVLIKVAYGTTSTTKRSIPDNNYVPSLTTIATPPLTTLRYTEKSPHQQQINLHHRNYELDLERDHALPTSAPNADILKSNSNPTYPNPNRHHNHDRERHRHSYNSTPAPSIHNLLRKGQPTIPMYPGDMPSYSPPARGFPFTPPLPPEYNSFADKPTLRGTNNDGGLVNTPGGSNYNTNIVGNPNPSYINRRPIPPPSLMPGHERIPLRPPDLIGQPGNGNDDSLRNVPAGVTGKNPGQQQRKKALNTPSQKVNNKIDQYDDGTTNNSSTINNANDDSNNNGGGNVHIPNISRILSGSNGKKEDIPDVLLKHVTNRPHQTSITKTDLTDDTISNKNPNINQSKNNHDEHNYDKPETNGPPDDDDDDVDDDDSDMDFDDIYAKTNQHPDEPKTQLTIKMSTKSTENPHNHQVYSTNAVTTTSSSSSSPIVTVGNVNAVGSIAAAAASPVNKKSPEIKSTDSAASSVSGVTWDVAWNIHVYLSVILFTILGVYSIFKMIFYDKLTHLFNQSYFICIHLILISICVARIFYLIYDAYNIHSSFHLLVSELLLNLPATFLTISFSVLILFLLIRSLNHKNNRYSALIRPLTVVVGSSVHVGLCITLHYVENYTTTNLHQQHQQQLQILQHNQQQQQQQFLYRSYGVGRPALQQPPPPPRVLSLICQIIYIFVCLSLGLLYLYIYHILKRVLRSKSQNYIHGYQNLSYAIHITIATALLFVLLAALQIFGAISISTTRSLLNPSTNGLAGEIDWLQWGYQFSLRLIEIAIIWLIGWVAGLKTGGGGGGGSGIANANNNGGISGNSLGGFQREKSLTNNTGDHNVSGFALFPCTSSSSQEHFETDYPAICNANTNLHTYTKRTGKPIYDDNFTLNSIQQQQNNGGAAIHQQRMLTGHQNNSMRSYETSSIRSGASGQHHHNDFINGSTIDSAATIDHYENPNFELRSNTKYHYQQQQQQQQQDNCYSEPLNQHGGVGNNRHYDQGYNFQNFERPLFQQERPNSRSSCLIAVNGNTANPEYHHGATATTKSNKSKLDRSNYENPERRSSNSTHSYRNGGGNYNSYDRRHNVVRKSGTLNNIGSSGGGGNNVVHGRSSSSSSTSSVSNQQQQQSTNYHHHHHHHRSGVQTLSSSTARNRGSNSSSSCSKNLPSVVNGFNRNTTRSSLERCNDDNSSSSGGGGNSSVNQQYILQSDDDIVLVAAPTAATNAINKDGCAAAIMNSISGGNIAVDSVNGSGSGSSSGESANSGSMLVAEYGFVRFRALDDINNAQGVGIHNASIRTTGGGGGGGGGAGGRNKDKRYTNNT